MPTITAYAYNGAIHCPRCARRALHAYQQQLTRPYPGPARYDEHGLPDDMVDCEGNPARPVFSTDENASGYCDTCGMAYGDAEPRAPVLRIEAWHTLDGWTWNEWHKRGTVPVSWCNLSPRALLRNLRAHGLHIPPGKCAVEDDGYNVVITRRGTREPLFAIAYGEALQ